VTRYQPLWLQAGSYAASADRQLLAALWPTAASSGGAVTPVAGMQVQAAAGRAAVPVANPAGTVLCAWDAPELVTLDPSPPSGTNRIDLVIVQARGNDLDGGVNNDFVVTFTKGAEAASPVAPAVPANAIALAQVAVNGGSASITAGNITDRRPGGLSAITAPRGQIGVITGPAANVSAGATPTTILTLSAPVTAGRWYRFNVFYMGTQQSAASGSVRITTSPSVVQFLGASNSLAQNAIFQTSGSLLWQAPTTGSQAFSVLATTAAGTLLSGTGQCQISVEDAGI
jgi:hypothetical protein